MVFVDCVGKLSDPVTQGDVFSIAQFFVERVMIVAGDESLVTFGEDCFSIGAQDFPGRPAVASCPGILPAVVAAPGRYRHGQAVWRETKQDAYQPAAEKGAQAAIVFILGVGKVVAKESTIFPPRNRKMLALVRSIALPVASTPKSGAEWVCLADASAQADQ